MAKLIMKHDYRFRFYNRTAKNLRVSVISTESRIVANSQSSDRSFETEIKGGGGGGTKGTTGTSGNGDFGVKYRQNIVDSESKNYEHSKFLEQCQVIVDEHSSIDFFTDFEKYITIYDFDKNLLLLNYKSQNWFFYYSEHNYGVGNPLHYNEQICLFNWRYSKFLTRYSSGEPRGRISDLDEPFYLKKSYSKAVKSSEQYVSSSQYNSSFISCPCY